MREVKYYHGHMRRYVQNNFQCLQCGNTDYFCIDLKLRHRLVIEGAGTLSVDLHPLADGIIANTIDQAWKLVDREPALIMCANCRDEGYVDLQERLLEYCWQSGCPGCEVCSNYITAEELRNLCSDCLRQNGGQMDEDDCLNLCPFYDGGLEAVRRHYGISLDDLKEDAGLSC